MLLKLICWQKRSLVVMFDVPGWPRVVPRRWERNNTILYRSQGRSTSARDSINGLQAIKSYGYSPTWWISVTDIWFEYNQHKSVRIPFHVRISNLLRQLIGSFNHVPRLKYYWNSIIATANMKKKQAYLCSQNRTYRSPGTVSCSTYEIPYINMD